MNRRPLLITIILIALSLYFIFPFYWLLISITKDTSQLFQKSILPGIPCHLVDNLKMIFAYRDGVFYSWLANSFLYAGIGALVAVLIASMAGFAFRRYDFFGKKILFILILGFAMVPGYATILPIFTIFRDLRLLDSRVSILLPSFINIFAVYLMITYWNQIPDELFDAAEIDGATDLGVFFKIGLPNIFTGCITLILLTFVTIWNNFFLPLVLLNSRAKMPLILGITTITDPQGFPVYNLTLISSFCTILPLLIIFITMQRFFKPQLFTGQ